MATDDSKYLIINESSEFGSSGAVVKFCRVITRRQKDLGTMTTLNPGYYEIRVRNHLNEKNKLRKICFFRIWFYYEIRLRLCVDQSSHKTFN